MPNPVKKHHNLLLALNLGNTNLTCGLFDRSSLLLQFPLPVAHLDDAGNFWAKLPPDLLDAVSLSVLASVNPPVARIVSESLPRWLGKPPLLLGPDLPIPVVARVDRPAEVGADRLLNVLAAFQHTHSASLVVDFGTALTIDVCSSSGEYLGGVIAPGLRIAASSLHRHTALLPLVDLSRPGAVTGRNTVDCIRSGLFWGAVSILEGLVSRLRAEHPSVSRVLATGGDAPLVASATSVIDEVVPDLTLQGIRLAVQAAGLTP